MTQGQLNVVVIVFAAICYLCFRRHTNEEQLSDDENEPLNPELWAVPAPPKTKKRRVPAADRETSIQMEASSEHTEQQ